MPFVSKAQARWGNSPSGRRALGDVDEWNQSTDFHDLPERKPMGNFIKKAVKHPGALTAAAKRHGLSTSEEAEKESHSTNPHTRTRGILGKRFISGDLHKK
jgi:hypothetical protein